MKSRISLRGRSEWKDTDQLEADEYKQRLAICYMMEQGLNVSDVNDLRNLWMETIEQWHQAGWSSRSAVDALQTLDANVPLLEFKSTQNMLEGEYQPGSKLLGVPIDSLSKKALIGFITMDARRKEIVVRERGERVIKEFDSMVTKKENPNG